MADETILCQGTWLKGAPKFQSRAEAKASGAIRYLTGRPCPKGHIAERYASTGCCVMCAIARTKKQTESGFYRALYQKNKEAVKKRAKETYPLRRAQTLIKTREWVKNNPEKRRVIAMSYKARRRAQEQSGISTADLGKWIKAQKKICYWCGARCRDRYHVDHYTPLSKGGKHERGNLVIACPTCNLTKSAADPYDFAARHGRLF